MTGWTGNEEWMLDAEAVAAQSADMSASEPVGLVPTAEPEEQR